MVAPRKTAPGVEVRTGIRIEMDAASEVHDDLAVEAPLHVKINGEPYTTTMRTPGQDEFLIRGLLFTEAIVSQPAAPMAFETISDPGSQFAGCVDVRVDPALIQKEFAARRAQLSASSCGLCGTREPRDIEIFGPPISLHTAQALTAAELGRMMARMRQDQAGFSVTGGSHAAAIFSVDRELLALHEDIGRHNAVDKAVGELLARNALTRAAVLTVSGRMSYEIVFKTYRAAIPILCAVSAPSSMAVDTCELFGMTLAAFCRNDRLTIYTHPERVR